MTIQMENSTPLLQLIQSMRDFVNGDILKNAVEEILDEAGNGGEGNYALASNKYSKLQDDSTGICYSLTWVHRGSRYELQLKAGYDPEIFSSGVMIGLASDRLTQLSHESALELLRKDANSFLDEAEAHPLNDKELFLSTLKDESVLKYIDQIAKEIISEDDSGTFNRQRIWMTFDPSNLAPMRHDMKLNEVYQPMETVDNVPTVSMLVYGHYSDVKAVEVTIESMSVSGGRSVSIPYLEPETFRRGFLKLVDELISNPARYESPL